MYICLLRVRHLSPHGEPYTRMHVVPVRDTLHAAVLACGAVPPYGTSARLSTGLPMPEIVYEGDTPPVSTDPGAIVLHIQGLVGGVYVHVPYQCTYEHLVRQQIPAKLRMLGVHPHDVLGALSHDSGVPVLARDLWGGGPLPKVWWVKMRCRVKHQWPAPVLRGLCALQRRYRAQKEWCML